jgi:hypothetical protein
MTSIARARRGFEVLGNEYEVRGGTSTAASTGPIAAAAETEARCARRAGQQETRWHQAERASRCKRKKYVLVVRVAQLVMGAHARPGVTSVEVNSAKAVRIAGLFLDINFLHGR